MATQKPQPVTHVYKEVNEGKFKSVKHYELFESSGTPLLSTLINISKDQNYAKSMPELWLRVRQDNKWTKYVTGLFKTSKKGIYKGDTQKKRNLLIFKFSGSGNTLTIEYYENFYTNSITTFL